MSTRIALVLTAVLTIGSGCAVMSMKQPKPKYSPGDEPACSTSSSSMTLDVIFGVAWAAIGLNLISNDESIGGLPALVGAAHLGSAGLGLSWLRKCKKRQKDHDTWLALRNAEQRAARQRAQTQRPQTPRQPEVVEPERPADPYATNEPDTTSGDTAKPEPASNADPRADAKGKGDKAPARSPNERRGNAHLRWPRGQWVDFWREVKP